MFSLTPQERKVILFLTAFAALGTGVNFFSKGSAGGLKLAPFSRELGKIDLNTADQKMLLTVPGIGEKLAERIISYRVRQNGFGSIQELREIKGISQGKFEKIKDYLNVRE